MAYTELKNVPKFYFTYSLICECEKCYNLIAFEPASAHGRVVFTEILRCEYAHSNLTKRLNRSIPKVSTTLAPASTTT
jgi:hypothetical protein